MIATAPNTMTTGNRTKVYLAGPDVFLPDAQERGNQKKALCAQYGFQGVFPLDAGPVGAEAARDAAFAVFEICVAMMHDCQLAIANLTPFRGVSMDVGTAVEIGYMAAIGKPVFGYTNVIESYKDRVEAAGMALGWVVEDYGLFDNLMCEGVVRRSGGEVVRHQVEPADRLANVQGFEDCLRQAARRFKTV
jgi:nucleoside 2-deoxyribosyltransferase